MVVDAQGPVAAGASGRRRVDEAAPLQPGDVFHLGSDTKAMTAFLVGKLVDDGVLGWDHTMAEVFREHAGSMHPAFRAVTVEQLLRHRGGMPDNLEPSDLGAVKADRAERGMRPEIARVVLSGEPAYEPGKAFAYSNVGYIVVGAVLETLTDKTWETLLQIEVFDPLGMTSCGFGPTATGSDPDGVWAHAAGEEGAYVPVSIDNPPFLGPAGTVHCSLADWGKFAAAQFDRSTDALVSERTLRRLHEPTPVPDGRGKGYALGWLVSDFEHGQGVVLTHDGSNTVNYASIAVIPELQLAVMAACNAGDARAQQAVVQAVVGLLDAYGRSGEAVRDEPAP